MLTMMMMMMMVLKLMLMIVMMMMMMMVLMLMMLMIMMMVMMMTGVEFAVGVRLGSMTGFPTLWFGGDDEARPIQWLGFTFT